MKKLLLLSAMSLLLLSANAQIYIAKRFQTPEEKLNDQYCSGLFQTAEGTIFNVGDDVTVKGYFNILDWLQGRVSGLQIFHQKDGTAIPVIRNQRASIYLDEMSVSPGTMNMISVSDIAMIKVIKGPFVGGFGNGGGGAIAIYTFNGDDEDEHEAGHSR